MKHRLGLVLPVGAMLILTACASTKPEDKLLRELANLDKETIYERAQALFDETKYQQARELFSFVYDTFPNDPLGHKAALRVADTYAIEKDPASLTEARLRYRDFANRYPNDPDRDYALLMLGQTYTRKRKRPDRDLEPLLESLDAYQQLITLYPDSPHVAEARTKLVEIREVLAEHEWLVARFYARNRAWRGTLSRLEYLRENYPDYSKMDQVDELAGRASEEIEKRETALKELLEQRKQEKEKSSLRDLVSTTATLSLGRAIALTTWRSRAVC